MAIQDELRRRRGPGAGGGGLAGGADPGQMQAFMGGVNQWDFSGPMGRDFAGGGAMGQQGGLLGLLAQGPAGRHFGRQGYPGPPGFEDQNPIGGPNMAPGNLDTGLAIGQPGVPQGIAAGRSGGMPPGQMLNTQAWRNYAPGHAMAAQLGYGAGQSATGGGRPFQGGPAELGGQAGPSAKPSAMGRGVPSSGTAETPMQGRPGNRGPGAPTGTGQGPTGKPGGGGKQAPAGVTPAVKQQAAGQSTERGGMGTPPNRTALDTSGGKSIKAQRREAKNNAYANAKSGNASGIFGDTIKTIPNAGNNTTPSETRKYAPPPKPKPATVGKKKSTGGGRRTVSNTSSQRR